MVYLLTHHIIQKVKVNQNFFSQNLYVTRRTESVQKRPHGSLSLFLGVSRPPVQSCWVEPDPLKKRRDSRQKPERDEGGDPGHARWDEKTAAGRNENHCRGGGRVWKYTHTYNRGHIAISYTYQKHRFQENIENRAVFVFEQQSLYNGTTILFKHGGTNKHLS